MIAGPASYDGCRGVVLCVNERRSGAVGNMPMGQQEGEREKPPEQGVRSAVSASTGAILTVEALLTRPCPRLSSKPTTYTSTLRTYSRSKILERRRDPSVRPGVP